MQPLTRLLLPCTLLALAAAGCAGATEATLSYEGSEAGTHEDDVACDQDGQLTVAGNVNDGEIAVTVLDGENAQVFNQQFDGTVDLESESLDGADGTWTVEVERTDGFDGSYTVTLGC